MADFYSQDSEHTILCCCVQHPDKAMPIVVEAGLRASDFSAANFPVFDLLSRFHVDSIVPDFALIGNELKKLGKLEVVGGSGAISALFYDSALLSTLNHHIDAVREKTAQRELYRALTGAVSEVEGQGVASNQIMAKVAASIDSIASRKKPKKAPETKELVFEALNIVQKRCEGDQSVKGVSTGIAELDKETGGLKRADTWVIAGLAKSGKTALANNLMASLAITNKRRTLLLSLEMQSVQNVERLFAIDGGVSAPGMRDGILTEYDMAKLQQSATRLIGSPIHFRDDVTELPHVVATIKQTKQAYPDLYAVFLDYAQLVQVGSRGDNREQEVAKVSGALRRLSIDENLLIVVLSQVNDDGKMRESRKLEMDGTTIARIEFGEDPASPERFIRLVQRGGSSGKRVRVKYIGDLYRFIDWPAGEEEAQPRQDPRKFKNRNESY